MKKDLSKKANCCGIGGCSSTSNNCKQSPEQRYKALKKIDLSLVDKRLDRSKIGKNSITKVKNETLKFLALSANKRRSYAPSLIVDEYWHQMILTTPVYEKVGKAVGGFIHHNPSDLSTENRKRDVQAFNQLLEDYPKHFGKMDSSIWSSGIQNQNIGKCNCSGKCNNSCSSKCSSHNCSGNSGGGDSGGSGGSGSS